MATTAVIHGTIFSYSYVVGRICTRRRLITSTAIRIWPTAQPTTRWDVHVEFDFKVFHDVCAATSLDLGPIRGGLTLSPRTSILQNEAFVDLVIF